MLAGIPQPMIDGAGPGSLCHTCGKHPTLDVSGLAVGSGRPTASPRSTYPTSCHLSKKCQILTIRRCTKAHNLTPGQYWEYFPIYRGWEINPKSCRRRGRPDGSTETREPALTARASNAQPLATLTPRQALHFTAAASAAALFTTAGGAGSERLRHHGPGRSRRRSNKRREPGTTTDTRR